MKLLILFPVLLFAAISAFADSEPKVSALASQFSFKEEPLNVLEEDDDVKKLILKYDSASVDKKPAIKKEIEKLTAQEEENSIKKHEVRIQRQEAKIKELKQKVALRKKNKTQNVNNKVGYLISSESVSKIKTESLGKKVTDKVKSKR